MRHIYIILTILTFLTVSCNSQTHSDSDNEAIELNNQAIKIINSDPDSALILLDKATNINKKNYVAYNNKVSVYCSKGDYENAIKAAKQGLKVKPDLAEAVTMLGMLYDYTGQPDKAKEQYQKAIDLYDNRISTSDKDKQANRLNKAHALLLIGNKTEGQKEVQELFKENPDDFTIQMLVDFEKNKYLNDLFEHNK